MADAAIIATNFRRIGKGTLLASVDLEITGWKLLLKECLWHQKDSREWIQFPRREYNDREGNRKFTDIISFTDRTVSGRFQAAALKAVHEIATP